MHWVVETCWPSKFGLFCYAHDMQTKNPLLPTPPVRVRFLGLSWFVWWNLVPELFQRNGLNTRRTFPPSFFRIHLHVEELRRKNLRGKCPGTGIRRTGLDRQNLSNGHSRLSSSLGRKQNLNLFFWASCRLIWTKICQDEALAIPYVFTKCLTIVSKWKIGQTLEDTFRNKSNTSNKPIYIV